MQSRANSNNGEKGTTIHELPTLNPNSGFTWLSNQLKGEGYSVFRFLPPFDDNGNEMEFMIAGADPNNMETALSSAFYQVEMATLYRGGVSKRVITSLSPVDRRGNPTPHADRTVASCVIGRFNYSVIAAKMLAQKGYEHSIPKEWIEKYDRKITNEQRPAAVTMVQALAFVINGISNRNGAGTIVPTPGVLIFQQSALKSLFTMLKTKKSWEAPISQSNLADHCDLFSCSNGHLARYTVAYENGKDNRPRPVYSLISAEPAPIAPAQASGIVKPWDKVLTLPTVEDQVELFVEYLGPDVVDFCLSESPYGEYVPASVRGAGKGIKAIYQKMDALKALPQNPNMGYQQTAAPQQQYQQPAAPQQTAAPRPAQPAAQAWPTPAPAIAMRPLPAGTLMDGIDEMNGLPTPVAQPAPVQQPVQQPVQRHVPENANAFSNNLMESMKRLQSPG